MRSTTFAFSLLVLSLLTFSLKSYGQYFQDGTDSIIKMVYAAHPEIQKENEHLLQNSLQTLSQFRLSHPNTSSSAPTYIIPVVFHILHLDGNENISDAQVIDAVNILNRDWRKRNADTITVIPQFQNLIADTKIEFHLATKDPAGNCTNGIEHIYTHKTNATGDDSKINQWPRSKYLNIWVVNAIVNTGGYAYGPAAANYSFIAPYDGIIIRNDLVGSIGTSSPNLSRALHHFVADYLGLLPPCGNPYASICGDDGIADTPITKGWTSCPQPQNAKICDTAIVENYQNYMEYSYCSNMFTLGQASFMQQALNSPLAQRDSLSTNFNIYATGADSASQANPTACAPVADFSANRIYICQGSPVSFVDHTWRSIPTTWSWTFPGGNPSSSTLQNPTIMFSTPGWQNITLTVTNSAGTDTKQMNNYIFVAPSSWQHFGAYAENFENNDFNNEWSVQNAEQSDPHWVQTSNAGYSGTQSLMLNNFGAPSDHGLSDAFITPSFNLSTCTPGTAQLSFKYSCASSAANTADVTEYLKVYVSTNCGTSWLLRKTITGLALTNTGYCMNSFVPNSQSQWVTSSYTMPGPDLTANTRFKFEYTSGPYSNNIYIDDINISATVGINEAQNYFFDLNVYPNPSNGNNTITISYSLTSQEKIKISLINMIGREIGIVDNEIESAGEKSLTIDPKGLNLNAGVYLVKISNGTSYSTKRLVISK